MIRRIALSFSFVVVCAAPASAQNLWLRQEGTGIALDYRRLSEEELEMDAFSGTYFLLGHFELRSGMQVVVEVPWARYKETGDDPFGPEEAQTAFGNVYFGLVQPAEARGTGFDIGLRLPSANDEFNGATFLGHLSSFFDHTSAYVPDLLSAVGGLRLAHEPSSNAELRARIGLVYLHPTDDGDADGEAFARLTGQALWKVDALRFGAGLEALWLVTAGGEGGIDDDSIVEAVLRGDYDFGPLTAGVQLELPLDEGAKNLIDHVIGVSLEVELP